MKIYFFKNHDTIVPRTSCTWEGVAKSEKYPQFKKSTNTVIITLISLLWIVPYLGIVLRFRSDIRLLPALCSIFLLIPIHEFARAFYALIAGKKIEGIYFFPPKFNGRLPKYLAYVYPSFGVYKKYEYILFLLFPLIFITSLSIIIGLITKKLAIYCFLTALLNIGYSIDDICQALANIKSEKKCLYFPPFGQIYPSEDKMVFRTIQMRADLKKLIKRQFVYQNKKFHEVTFKHDEHSKELEKDFINQFEILKN